MPAGIADGVAGIIDDIGVVAGQADHVVGASTAIDKVVAGRPDEQVIAAAIRYGIGGIEHCLVDAETAAVLAGALPADDDVTVIEHRNRRMKLVARRRGVDQGLRADLDASRVEALGIDTAAAAVTQRHLPDGDEAAVSRRGEAGIGADIVRGFDVGLGAKPVARGIVALRLDGGAAAEGPVNDISAIVERGKGRLTLLTRVAADIVGEGKDMAGRIEQLFVEAVFGRTVAVVHPIGNRVMAILQDRDGRIGQVGDLPAAFADFLRRAGRRAGGVIELGDDFIAMLTVADIDGLDRDHNDTTVRGAGERIAVIPPGVEALDGDAGGRSRQRAVHGDLLHQEMAAAVVPGDRIAPGAGGRHNRRTNGARGDGGLAADRIAVVVVTLGIDVPACVGGGTVAPDDDVAVLQFDDGGIELITGGGGVDAGFS